jgi:hypothetical protein
VSSFAMFGGAHGEQRAGEKSSGNPRHSNWAARPITQTA